METRKKQSTEIHKIKPKFNSQELLSKPSSISIHNTNLFLIQIRNFRGEYYNYTFLTNSII